VGRAIESGLSRDELGGTLVPRLAGKVAFITGAGTGIGRATALRFAREGARVVIAEINLTAGEETAHLAGNEAIAIRTDVTVVSSEPVSAGCSLLTG
jgi:NAD(P)-dependent dehydrogenase (short-subunit alcohol dehydrogenase family)